jgi:hypothetical protein
MILSMIQPKQESTQATKDKRAGEEQASLWDSYQSHQKETKNYEKTDGMPGPFAPAVTAEWHNLGGVQPDVVRGKFSPLADFERRRNH